MRHRAERTKRDWTDIGVDVFSSPELRFDSTTARQRAVGNIRTNAFSAACSHDDEQEPIIADSSAATTTLSFLKRKRGNIPLSLGLIVQELREK